jgi:hypothetical protein
MRKQNMKYCCDDDRKAYEDYYVNQCGHGLPVFYGSRIQRGHGIGSIFSGLFRTIFPILKRVAPIIGRKALKTGMQIASDVAGGQSFGDSAKARVMNVIEEGINKIVPSESNQSGSGIRRKRKRSNKKTTGRKRRKFADIFS